MVNQTIHAVYSETYDLNTINSELCLIGIHTPTAGALKKMYKGFFEQYKKFKILGCNFNLVCASRQDLDPTLVGFSEGQIDPRDVLNPILFKACTGDNLNQLVNQIYNKSLGEGGNAFGGSINQVIDNRALSAGVYYQLLADNDWRKEHPQRGITVSGLQPMVHKVVTTQPFKYTGYPLGGVEQEVSPFMSPPNASTGVNNAFQFGGVSGNQSTTAGVTNPTVFVSNGITEMPWLDTVIDRTESVLDNTTGETKSVKANVTIQSVPRVYMGALILPPATNTNLYYRMTMVWHILFKDFRPAYEVGPLDSAYATGQTGNDPVGMSENVDSGTKYSTYFNLYHTASMLQKSYGSFDVSGADNVAEVNQSVR